MADTDELAPAKDEKGRFVTGNIGGGRPCALIGTLADEVAVLLPWLLNVQRVHDGLPVDDPEFTTADWELVAKSIYGIIPELERRGFRAMPWRQAAIDPLGFMQDWCRYLQSISLSIYNGDAVLVEVIAAQVSVKH